MNNCKDCIFFDKKTNRELIREFLSAYPLNKFGHCQNEKFYKMVATGDSIIPIKETFGCKLFKKLIK